MYDLIKEQKNNILKRYLTDDNFSQNIVNRKSEVQRMLEKKFARQIIFRKKFNRSKILGFILLQKTRKNSLEKLLEDKVKNIESLNPQIISTGNVGCITQISNGTNIPILHTVELLDWYTGGPKPKVLY